MQAPVGPAPDIGVLDWRLVGKPAGRDQHEAKGTGTRIFLEKNRPKANMGSTDSIEWDDTIDATNLAKHGLSLALADGLFNGPVFEVPVERPGLAESRILAIGIVQQTVLSCVYVYRGTKRRIISLRPASRQERRAYAEALARLRERLRGH